jgi:proline iminopeptidase
MPMLDVGDGHTMYYETHGNPKGRPVVCLHGGPGGGLVRFLLPLFDLKRWHVILYDQRGCGKSTPRLELKNNTTWHLVNDMETLRKHLEIETWCVYGGSWGTTLALAYASKHLDRVTAFVLRGVCLFTKEEVAWMFEKGHVSTVFPKAWSNVTEMLRKGTRKITKPYRKLLLSKKTQKAASKAWSKYEHDLSYLVPKPFKPDEKSDVETSVLETHYFVHNAWLTSELLLETAKTIKVPVLIVQGRYDMVCPASSAILLKDAIPHAKLIVVPNAGHATREKGIFSALKKGIQKLIR